MMFRRAMFVMTALLAAAVVFGLTRGVLGAPDISLWRGQCDLRDGDLVFVRGRSWRSWLVRTAGEPEDFSHVGIVVTEGGKPRVLHAKPNAETVQIESVDDFLSASRVGRAGVYRVKSDGGEGKIASAEALGYFEDRKPFDGQFDISNGDRLYCTELVWLAYKRAGIDLGLGDPNFLFDSKLYGKVLLPFRLSESACLAKVADISAF
jgi:hypothetical protein